MTNGRKRFDFYLDQLELLINKASAEASPALWLYENNARSVLFMLEALSKLYSNLHDKEMFKKNRDKFKELEDILGDIDHYDNYVKQFTGKEIPASVIAYIQQKREEAVNNFTHALKEEEWNGKENKRIMKIRKKLDAAKWLEEEEEMAAIRSFYEKEIGKINEFYNETEKPFENLEDQVHEIRRKLRWLSIYPQALRGCIQLKESSLPDEHLRKYLTPEVINSPFNKLPEPKEYKFILLLDKYRFLALSWIISELGELKDKGLTIDVLKEAKSHLPHLTESVDDLADATLPGTSIENVLKQSSELCRVFFSEMNLDKLTLSVTKC